MVCLCLHPQSTVAYVTQGQRLSGAVLFGERGVCVASGIGIKKQKSLGKGYLKVERLLGGGWLRRGVSRGS